MSTLQVYIDGGALQSSFKTGNSYGTINGSSYYATTSATIAGLWGINTSNAPNYTQAFLGRLHYGGTLSQFAQSSDNSNGTIYLVDSGKYLPVSSMAALLNVGYSGQNVPIITPSTINASLGSAWQGYLATDASGSTWVLDGGSKRIIPNQYLGAWTTSQTPTALTGTLLSLLPTGSALTNAIKSYSNPTIYGIKNGLKYGIPSPSVYNSSGLSTVVIVSESLLQLIPSGGVWAN